MNDETPPNHALELNEDVERLVRQTVFAVFSSGFEQGKIAGTKRVLTATIRVLEEMLAVAETGETPIQMLELSTRTFHVLQKEKIFTIGQLTLLSREQLTGLHGLGDKGVQEVADKLKAYHYTLNQE